MATFRNYDPGKIIVVFNGIQLQGYADGEFVKGSRAEDTFKATAGAGGDTVRVRNRNRMGGITVTLQGASQSNDLLSAIAVADELNGTGVGPLMVKDLAGTTLIQAANAWIRKIADVPFAADHTNREWNIDCAELEVFTGGELS